MPLASGFDNFAAPPYLKAYSTRIDIIVDYSSSRFSLFLLEPSSTTHK